MASAQLYIIHALSPLHAGTGQGTGVIDLPIARERATAIPYLPGSSVKGTLRDSDYIASGETKKKLFGPETVAADEHAGAAIFADARLLLLPVRSLCGTFAWVTSPYLLHRLKRDAQDIGLELPDAVPALTDNQHVYVTSEAVITYKNEIVVLEDLDLKVQPAREADWAAALAPKLFPNQAEQELFRQRFCVVHDDLLRFLLTTATEVVARIRLQEQQKTVAAGALWYEEMLPTESILVGVLMGQRVQNYAVKQVLEDLQVADGKVFQFGGKATVGRGLCRLRLVGGAA